MAMNKGEPPVRSNDRRSKARYNDVTSRVQILGSVGHSQGKLLFFP